MSDFIKDGTGNGYLTRVTSSNRILGDVISEPLSAERSRMGMLYGTGTGSISLDASMSFAPVLWLQNDDPDRLMYIEQLIFGWNGGSTNYNRTVLNFIKYQATQPTTDTADASPAIENINRSGSASAVTHSLATALKWDGTGTSGMSGGSGGYLQIPNRLAQGNTSLRIGGEIILGQGDTMQMEVTPEEAGLYNVAIVYYMADNAGRENE